MKTKDANELTAAATESAMQLLTSVKAALFEPFDGPWDEIALLRVAVAAQHAARLAKDVEEKSMRLLIERSTS